MDMLNNGSEVFICFKHGDIVMTSCSTVQDDLLAREIFGEFVSEIQLANFILAILL